MGISSNKERESSDHEETGKDLEETSIKLTSVKAKKDVAEQVRVYCFLHRIKMSDFTSAALEEKLGDFKRRLEELRKVESL